LHACPDVMNQIAVVDELRNTLSNFDGARQYCRRDNSFFRRTGGANPPQKKDRNNRQRSQHNRCSARYSTPDFQERLHGHEQTLRKGFRGVKRLRRDSESDEASTRFAQGSPPQLSSAEEGVRDTAGAGQAPRTPTGVRIWYGRQPGVARYRSHTPGYYPRTPPACKSPTRRLAGDTSDCLSCQHVFARSGLQGELVFNIELRIVRSFRIHAVIATIFGFPAVSNRW